MILKKLGPLKSALKMGEQQATVIIFLTMLNGIALLKRTSETPAWLVVVALSMWFVVALIANLTDQIYRRNNHDRHK